MVNVILAFVSAQETGISLRLLLILTSGTAVRSRETFITGADVAIRVVVSLVTQTIHTGIGVTCVCNECYCKFIL